MCAYVPEFVVCTKLCTISNTFLEVRLWKKRFVLVDAEEKHRPRISVNPSIPAVSLSISPLKKYKIRLYFSYSYIVGIVHTYFL